jgi:hypothetical protein
MNKLVAVLGAILTIAVSFPVFGQNQAKSTIKVLPKILIGQLSYSGPPPFAGPASVLIDDQSNPADIKGKMTAHSKTCQLTDVPFTSASFDGKIFVATSPIPESCISESYKKGAPMVLTLDKFTFGPDGKVTAKGTANNDSNNPRRPTSSRRVELSGTI